jgi:hypothetical protein
MVSTALTEKNRDEYPFDPLPAAGCVFLAPSNLFRLSHDMIALRLLLMANYPQPVGLILKVFWEWRHLANSFLVRL